jgi:hypothetical protein
MRRRYPVPSSSNCPVCGSVLKRHCPEPNTTCTWQKCARLACNVVMGRRRGYTIRNGVTVILERPAGGAA